MPSLDSVTYDTTGLTFEGLVMSLGVIPLLLHRPPSITIRWWIQLIGHVPFVGVPIVASISRGP